jgi:hypothetical protein
LKALEEKFGEMKGLFDPTRIMNARFPDHPLNLFSPDSMAQIRTNIEMGSSYQPELIDRIVGKNLRSFFMSSLPQ